MKGLIKKITYLLEEGQILSAIKVAKDSNIPAIKLYVAEELIKRGVELERALELKGKDEFSIEDLKNVATVF